MLVLVPQFLQCHPASVNRRCHRVQAGVAFGDNGALRFTYRIDAAPAGLLLPAEEMSLAQDNLWQHTCCEAFVGCVGQAAYREFNFSPSTCWAVYDFAGYRQRNPSWIARQAPQIEVRRDAAGFVLEACVAPALLPAGKVFDISLTCVIESPEGDKTYWALQHAADQPDFHLRQSFQLTLKVKES